ncbi:hypothetical protein QQ056_14775 [Oscillatoria laete-virens NRMC-F 0139]|nr:hypothetical protein [Oscillatoria laete-virens]MDL5054801.1 hypothetical protein [Oscillatoria laete-virens NRMC-F 0139]
MSCENTPAAAGEVFTADNFSRKYGSGPIGRFYEDHLTPDCSLFTHFRFVKYFRQDQSEPPTPLAQLIGKRLAPAPAYQASTPLAEARRGFVLPKDAPRTISSIAELIMAFDSVPPLKRDVMVELKFILRSDAAPNDAYEAVRGFALDHFARERGLAAMLVLHLPGRSGATAENHVHLFVPARRLTAEGFGAHAGNLIHDDGFEEVSKAWLASLESLPGAPTSSYPSPMQVAD